ncbi:MAG: amidase [Mycobacterium sp.]|jgi:amidase|nr:amidase [Mycobacterium sp.]
MFPSAVDTLKAGKAGDKTVEQAMADRCGRAGLNSDGTNWYRHCMTRIHAFGDDALGDLDAVGLVDAMRAGTVSAGELVEAAIARTKAVNPILNGLAFEAFDRARARASSRRPYGGYFDGVPSFIKDNVAVEGMPTMQGTDAWDPRLMLADGEFARMFLATGLVALGKTQMSEFGFSGSAEHPRIGPVRNPWNPEHTAGASSSGSGAFVAAGVVPIAHANDGGGSIRIPAACNGLVGLKPSRARLPLDKETARMPLHLVANGVLTRSVRDTAAFLRESERVYRNPKLPAIGDITHPGARRLRIAVCTKSILREASPEVRELTLKSAALLEELGHRVTEIDNPVAPRFKDDFLVYWSFLAFAVVRGGRRMFGPSFDRARLDSLTLGLDRNAARSLHKVPLAVARLSASHRITARIAGTYDAVLMPTLAEVTPRIGHLDPTAGYEQVMDRLIDWVGFTPLQNATGDPAISLPLGESASGLPVGMMLSTVVGQEARLIELAYELEDARPWARIQS